MRKKFSVFLLLAVVGVLILTVYSSGDFLGFLLSDFLGSLQGGELGNLLGSEEGIYEEPVNTPFINYSPSEPTAVPPGESGPVVNTGPLRGMLITCSYSRPGGTVANGGIMTFEPAVVELLGDTPEEREHYLASNPCVPWCREHRTISDSSFSHLLCSAGAIRDP